MKKRGSDDFPFNDLAGSRKSPWNDAGGNIANSGPDPQRPQPYQNASPQQRPPSQIPDPQRPQPYQNTAPQQRAVYQIPDSQRPQSYQNMAPLPREQKDDTFGNYPDRSTGNSHADYGDSYPAYQQNAPRARTLNRQIQILLSISLALLCIVILLGYFTFFTGKNSSSAETKKTAVTSSKTGTSDTTDGSGNSVTSTPAPGLSVTPVSTVSTDPNSLANLPPSKEHPVIALTFDDGPSGTLTPKLLDILEKKGVHVTFFMLGQEVLDADPTILKRMVADGDELGNHSYDHAIYTKLTETQIRSELTKTNDAIFAAAGVYPTVMRPPNGAKNETVLALSKEMNMPVVNWSYESCPQDWVKEHQTAEFISNYVIKNGANGHIVLMHDIHTATVDSIAAMIDGLRAKGYRFATVSELLSAQPSGKQNGVLYCYGTFPKVQA